MNINLGRWGEKKAVLYLTGKGYSILECNYRCRFGEIDIIAEKDEVIIFVEVKTRNSIEYGLPGEAITSLKKQHISNCLQFYLKQKGFYSQNCDFNFSHSYRIDLIEILKVKGRWYIRHNKNIF